MQEVGDVVNNPGFGDVKNSWLNTIWDKGAGLGQSGNDAFNTKTTGLVNDFISSFSNLVGRNPDSNEISTYYKQFLQPHIGNLLNPNASEGMNSSDYIKKFVADNFQGAAQSQAEQQLQDQQGKSDALAEQFRTQGNASLDSVANRLKDFVQSTYERIRPNLITSLASQGILDTGGLNEALAGSAADLARGQSDFLANASLNNENAANQIRYAGASAPLQFQMNSIMQRPDQLYQQGANASTNVYNNMLQQQAFQRQMALLNRQGQIASDMQPSMLSTLGQSFAGSFGQNAGKQATSIGQQGLSQGFQGLQTGLPNIFAAGAA